jgi:hypothetical protein
MPTPHPSAERSTRPEAGPAARWRSPTPEASSRCAPDRRSFFTPRSHGGRS